MGRSNKLIDYAALKSAKGITYSRVHLARMVKAGAFPAPLRLSPARIAWREEDIDEWVESKFQTGTAHGAG